MLDNLHPGSGPAASARPLSGSRVLILEDEPGISAILESAVDLAGCAIVGPASDIGGALRLIDAGPIDVAILDLIVDGVYCDAVADALLERGIPFAVTTGLGAITGHPLLASVPCITKPFRDEHVRDVLTALLER